jgi:recombinational DNA repair protein (RecF pathway)
MQGFIVHINRAREEDLIVSILTQNSLKSTYRFYGARHSIISLGYLIDFELEHSARSSIAQLRSVMHLAQSWNLDRDRMYFWQQFVGHFWAHLRDVEEIEGFYFDLLMSSSERWRRQNPKRVVVEAYLRLLRHEGRLHISDECFLCEHEIDGERVAWARACLAAHCDCVHSRGIPRESLDELITSGSTISLGDEEVDYLYKVVEEGF